MRLFLINLAYNMDAVNIPQEKKELRALMFQQRNLLTDAFKKQYDLKVCSYLIDLVSNNSMQIVHCYLPFAGEIDIKPFIQFLLDAKITVVVPKTLPKRILENRILKSLDSADIEVGIKNTLHPKNPVPYTGEFDLVVIPGLACDQNNFRLGYGGGYYDNFLIQHPHAFKLGIFYPFQQLENIPLEEHDQKLDEILIF